MLLKEERSCKRRFFQIDKGRDDRNDKNRGGLPQRLDLSSTVDALYGNYNDRTRNFTLSR